MTAESAPEAAPAADPARRTAFHLVSGITADSRDIDPALNPHRLNYRGVPADYETLLWDIMVHGAEVDSRARDKDGNFVGTKAVFGRQLRYDLADGFPAITTKKLFWKGVVAELIWFLNGDNSVKTLEAQGVKIWSKPGWIVGKTEEEKAEGSLGHIYGDVWRRFPKRDGSGTFDQIHELLGNIILAKNDPNASCGRRLIVTAWHPEDVHEGRMGLPPCHYGFQMRVLGGRLHCHMTMRSVDSFLGMPFNIASYALLTHVLAHATGLPAGELVMTFADTHIYANHFEQVREQLTREPYPFPALRIRAEDYPIPRDLRNIDPRSFELVDYRSHPALKGEVAE